ncbi:alpha/beta hydrolase [Streptomyces sp. V4I2]|uniref:alpha/beta hydrolase n=1 Tax=Streptomyces sp. V4I2 TaxID=3042280 RepID=UPI00278558A9|nr:pimeloyl-ACP methyl ester carboxylesterase [Streptomyces sp. V4I2]
MPDSADPQLGPVPAARSFRTGSNSELSVQDTYICLLDREPVVIGHSFGGLITQMIAGRGLSAASVAIDPAPFRGVLPLPVSSLRAARPVLGNPANFHRAVPLIYDQFRYAFANTVSEEEASTRSRHATRPPSPKSRSCPAAATR